MEWKTLKRNAQCYRPLGSSLIFLYVFLKLLNRGIRLPDRVEKAMNYFGVSVVNVPWILAPLLKQPRSRGRYGRIGRILGFILFIMGASLGFYSTFRRDIIGLDIPRGVISDGAYGYMRHPTYVGVLLSAIGWSLLWRAPYATALVPIQALFFTTAAHVEEKKQLIPVLGDEYEKYRSETPFSPVAFSILFSLAYIVGLAGLKGAEWEK